MSLAGIRASAKVASLFNQQRIFFREFAAASRVLRVLSRVARRLSGELHCPDSSQCAPDLPFRIAEFFLRVIQRRHVVRGIGIIRL